MRNLIKKILKESDEWDWVGDATDTPVEWDSIKDLMTSYEGVKFIQPTTAEDIVYTITKDTGERFIYVEWIENDYIHKAKLNRNTVTEKFKSGVWKLINIIKESDEWDWVRESKPWISFEEAKEDHYYNIEKSETLLNALMSCNLMTSIYYDSVKVEVVDKMYIKYSDVYCGSENDDEVLSLHLMFYNENGYGINSFWVTEDMVTLYPITDDINESTENPLKWIEDVPTGVELQPNTLYYFEPPLNLGEIATLANLITNSPIIKEWLLRQLDSPMFFELNRGLKYFVTRDNVNERIQGWCTDTDIEWAKGLYPKATPVDGRKEFGL